MLLNYTFKNCFNCLFNIVLTFVKTFVKNLFLNYRAECTVVMVYEDLIVNGRLC